MNDWEIEAAARRFALLSDPTRLRVLHTVMERGELSVHAIAEAAGVSRFNTSAHLNRLANGGLLARRREASTVYYHVTDRELAAICQSMCDSLHATPAVGRPVDPHASSNRKRNLLMDE